jgi:hypothetical protein
VAYILGTIIIEEERYMPLYDPTIAVPGTITAEGNTLTFTPATPFSQNMEYTVVVSGDIKMTDGTPLGSDYQFMFQSKLSPMYCDIDIILDDISEFIGSSFPKSVIARYIYRASRFVDEMALDDPMPIDEVTGVATLTYEAEQFVRYEVDMQLIQLTYLGKVGAAGDSVTLADFSIKKSSTLSPDLQSAYKDIRGKRQLFYDGIMGHHNRRYAKSTSTIRQPGTTSPIPVRSWE